jgi:hypothetical protein
LTGSVLSWGANRAGQLGTGSVATARSPVPHDSTLTPRVPLFTPFTRRTRMTLVICAFPQVLVMPLQRYKVSHVFAGGRTSAAVV